MLLIGSQILSSEDVVSTAEISKQCGDSIGATIARSFFNSSMMERSDISRVYANILFVANRKILPPFSLNARQCSEPGLVERKSSFSWYYCIHLCGQTVNGWHFYGR